MTAIQLIDRIEYIHSKYIIHRDIKPENFLIGNPDSSTIYLIDFGFAKKYRSSRTKKHIAYKVNKHFPGTIAFLSLNATKGIEQTRRDDLESLAYSLIYLFNGTLPWIDKNAKITYETVLKVYEIKKNICIENLCKGLPKEFVIFIEYVRNLKFDEDPNYNFLKNLFVDVLKSMNEENDSMFSWINQNDNNKFIVQPKRNFSNNLYKRKTSARKRILENLDKLRTISESKNNRTVENDNHNIFYNNTINLNNLNIVSKKENQSYRKINNLDKNTNKNIKEKNGKNEIEAEQKMHQIFSYSQIQSNNLNNKQPRNNKKVIYTNTKNDNKNSIKIKNTTCLHHTRPIPLPISKIDEKLNSELNNNIEYKPKTEGGLMYKKLKFSTSISNQINPKYLNKIKNNPKNNPAIGGNTISCNITPRPMNNSNYFTQIKNVNIDHYKNNIPKNINIKNDQIYKLDNIKYPQHNQDLKPNYNSNVNFAHNYFNLENMKNIKTDSNINNYKKYTQNFINQNNKINTDKYILINKNINLQKKNKTKI